MAFQDDVTWDAKQFQMDRYGMGVKETNSLMQAGKHLMGLIQGTGPKSVNHCQVRK